jgi:formate hydrogenlyase subunit 6/NADH:ubiquinone oxidoreductase subunit I
MSKKVGSAIPEMIRTLTRAPETEAYPFRPIHLPERFRGKLDIDPEKCTGCQICAMVCPTGCITMQDVGTRKVGDRELPLKKPLFDLARCISCGECVDNCSFNALVLTQQFELATTNKHDMMMTKALVK